MRARAPQPKRLRGLDRLPTLSLVLGLAACAEGGDSAGVGEKKQTGRVNAVAAQKVEPIDPNEFCEPWVEADVARAFAYPQLTGGDAAAVAGKRRWVNVWATWCKPCVEELPRLAKWQEQLKSDGVDFDLILLSADGDPQVVSEFRKKHREVEGTLEIADAAHLGAWLGSIGLSEDSVLPIHLFLDPAGKVRCVRMAGVGEPDFSAVKQILQQL